MNVRDISNVESFINDSSQYKGEIFVNVNSNTAFDTVKPFIDEHNLIAFIPGEDSIYAQNHTYKGLTSEQISAITNYASQINSLRKKLAIVNDSDGISDDERQSIIGTLAYGEGENKITSSNVTDFIKSVVTRIQAGDSAVTDAIELINTRITGLGNSLTNTLNIIAAGDYATRVINDEDDEHIEVTLVQTENTDVNTNEQKPFIPPYTFKIKSKNIASTEDLSNLSGSINSRISAAIADVVGGAPESLNTLKEIADWIEAHPEDTAQMNSDINTLKQKVSDLLGTVTETVTDPETGNQIEQIKKFSNSGASLNGTSWATSIEDINKILDKVSWATNVQDNAEANKIDAIDFVSQNIAALTGDNTDTSVKLGQTLLNEEKNVSISLNLESLQKIKTNILNTASTDATTKANAAENNAKSYVDEKLSWIEIN